MEEKHPDRNSFDSIWEKIINKEIQNYQSKYVNCIELIPNPKEEIWDKYVSLNNYCKSIYMMHKDGKLDRHKVAACYMIAIASTRPMRFVKRIDNGVSLAINETLAITVGLSLLRAFAIAAIKEKKDISDVEADKLISKFDSGIKIPDDNFVNHGEYINNFANEIFFAISEGKMCILSLAHELYLLELYTLISGSK